MTNWKSVRIGCAAGTLALIVAGSVTTSAVNHKNQLTFSRAVALPGVVLAGRYSFDAEDSDPRIVVVRTMTKIFYRGFTSDIRRPKGMSPNTLVTMGEAPTNQAPPITTWYEMGERTGHEFRY